jgi:REP element-mobilizing transposase RayT
MSKGYNSEKHHRRSIRVKRYDYSQPGAYFVTLVTQNRVCLFCDVEGSQIQPNEIGELIMKCWLRIPNHFSKTNLDDFVLMPNHLHGIIFIYEALGKGEASPGIVTNSIESISGDASPLQPRETQSRSLGAIIQNFKSVSTRQVNRLYFEPGNKIWQRNYYERIIRNERELDAICQYIHDNPLNWALDKENPTNL